MIWAGHVARMGDTKVSYRVLVGRPVRKRPLGRPRRRWENNTILRLQVFGWGGMDCIDLAQDSDRWQALVSEVMNIITVI